MLGVKGFFFKEQQKISNNYYPGWIGLLAASDPCPLMYMSNLFLHSSVGLGDVQG